MQPGVKIVYGQGGLGRPIAGNDYISGLIFLTDNVPSGFTTSNNKKQFLSLADAVTAGIKNDFSDETQGTGTIQVTTAGTTGDIITVSFKMPNGIVITLGTYTKIAGDSTDTLVATAIKNAINVNTPTTGFSATSSTDTVTVHYAKGLGIYPNSGTPLAASISGATMAVTVVQSVVDGVASQLIQWWYHIKEYFRLQPQGNLFVGFYPLTDNAYNLAEITNLQAFAQGTMRQMGVYLGNSTVTSASGLASMCDLAQAQATALATIHAPLSIVLGTDISGITDMTTFSDLSQKSDNRVSATLGQDGPKIITTQNGVSTSLETNLSGWSIFKAQGFSITNLGAVLGAISLSAVNESQAWIQKFNLTDGVELSVPAFGNGHVVDLVNDDNLMTLLDNYRYLFIKNFIGTAGTFLCNNPTAIASSSDYAYINDNRTIDKAARGLYTSFLPFLSGTIHLNADGTLQDTDIAYLLTLGNVAIDPMVNAGEISADGITIDPTQKILQTNTLVVAVKLVPDGVARNIVINLGYAQSV